jgi:hypothetical protein
MRGGGGIDPADEAGQVGLGHGGAASAGFVGAAPDMEEDGAAVARSRRLLIMADFEHPLVSRVAEAHFLLLKPWRNALAWVNADVAVVIRRVRVIHIGIPRPDLNVWPAGTARRRGSVAKQAAELENTCGRLPVLLNLGREFRFAVD